MDKGIHAFYKPRGVSSYDVIRTLKDLFPGEKIGHGGTLDPHAEGVLVIAIGEKFTRQLQHVLNDTTKTYVADIILGIISETDDSDGPFVKQNHLTPPNVQTVQQVLQTFIGEIEQIPPVYSAIKINGTAAYRRIRKGQKVTMPIKKVTIYSIELLRYDFPRLKIVVTCASGVYIRSLARDIGEKLKTGAYLAHLQRTAVGNFTLEHAIRLDIQPSSKLRIPQNQIDPTIE